MLVNSLTLFALSILLIRTTWSLVQNTTTIEGWEIERHATILRRARVLGGYLEGPDGQQVRIRRQEFPYDIGFWKNLKQAFGGSANVGMLIRSFPRRVADSLFTILGSELVVSIR